jgi:protocatechuate 3,4-dioxygenase beta subunit
VIDGSGRSGWRVAALPRARRAGRAVLGALWVMAGVGGIPGASLTRLAPLAPFAQDEAPPVPSDLKDRDASVDVTVRSAPGGAPVRGARVRALAMIDDRAYLAQTSATDAGGEAHLLHLPRGEAWILADAPGRARGSTRLYLDAAPRAVAIELGPEHALDVVVNDDLGAPVDGTELEVVSASPLPVGARTAADGRARVGRLGPGPWRVTARAPGYEEVHGRGVEGTPVVLVLRKLGAIAVHVVAEGGVPAAGARVAVAGATLWPARTAMADERGDVRIGSLEAGTYALRATKDDAVSAIDFDVAMGRGEEKPVVLQLSRGRFVAALVTDGEAADADPVRAARVTVAEGGLSPFPLEATTDAAGRARLGPIAPGGATLSARADGFVSRGTVAVPDPPPAELRVALARAGALTGRVVDVHGRPIDGATLEIVGTDLAGQPIFDDPQRTSFQAAHFDAMLGGPSPLLPAGELGVVAGPVPPIPGAGLARLTPAGSAPGMGAVVGAAQGAEAALPWVTAADGTFRASPASPGRVRVVVRHPQYVEAQSDLVTLAPGGEAHVDLVMHEGGALEGRVLDANGRPVEGARVVVSATRGSLERTTRTASDGTFVFVALPEAVLVSASASDGDTPDVRTTVAIPEGGRKEMTIALPEPRDALPIAVVDASGWPVEAAQVSASSLSPESVLRTTAFTDAHGEASLRRARGLPLRVEVRAPSHAPRVVTADGTEESLHVELAPAERATGEVVAERGRDPIAGATISLYTDLGARRARTNADGAFTLAELAPGNARMTVRAAGYAPVTRPIAIPSSDGRSAFAIPRVELAAEGSIEGEVVDGRGDPIAGARVAKDDVPTWLLVGTSPDGIAVTDAKGRFALHELPEGAVSLEAYAPGIGRSRPGSVKVTAGRTTDRVRVVIAPDGQEVATDLAASGSVAVTLGETGAPAEVVVVSVVELSEAERAGLVPGDVLVAVDGANVGSMEEARAKLSGPLAEDVVVAVRRGDQTFTLRVGREALRR